MAYPYDEIYLESVKKKFGILFSDIKQAISEPFYPEAEYWSGTVLAYCQWKTGKSFSTILAQYPLERILSNYHLMHEADITKMVNLIEAGFNASNS